MIRRLILGVLVCVLATACTGGSETTTTGVLDETSTTTGTDSTSTTLEPPGWTELPGIEDLPQPVQDELLELVRVTEEIRGLRFVDPPMISLVSEAELERRVRETIAEEAEDFPADEALYKLLGLLEPGVDLETLLIDLYGEQAAGFYNGETGEMVVPIRAVGFSITQRVGMVHELTHALTDQHFDFQPKLKGLFDAGQFDQASAYQALIEGDAQHVEFMYLQSLSFAELGEFIAEVLELETPALNAAPQFIQDSLLFPYDSGLGFVQRLESLGGWESVNEAYVEFPGVPPSTEQVMTPSDYGRDLPVEVQLPELDVPGYTLQYDSVWGEFGFRSMLDQVLGEDIGQVAADGWGGDGYYQWFNGQDAAIIIGYRGDTATDLEELEEALLSFARTSVPEEDWVWVESFGDVLYFIAADETSVGESLLAAVSA
jgi:hypothetical protein